MTDGEAGEGVKRLERWLEDQGITLTIPKHAPGEKWKVSLVADVNEQMEEEVVGEGDGLVEAVLDAFAQWGGESVFPPTRAE